MTRPRYRLTVSVLMKGVCRSRRFVWTGTSPCFPLQLTMALPLIFTFDLGEALRKSPTTSSLLAAYSTAAVTLLATSSLNVVAAYSTFAVCAGYLILKAQLNALHYVQPRAPILNSATNKITRAFCCSCCLSYGSP